MPHRARCRPGVLPGEPRAGREKEDVVTVYWDDSFADMLAGLRGPGFEFVRTSDMLKGADGANELHPNLNGFRKIARRFRKTLLKHLP